MIPEKKKTYQIIIDYNMPHNMVKYHDVVLNLWSFNENNNMIPAADKFVG